VNVEQSTRIAVAFAREAAKSPEARLCAACVEVLAVSGAGITIMGGGQAGPICVSNSLFAQLEDLQFTLGEGPCQDAFHSGVPVHVPQLGDAASARWPAFVDLANLANIGAAFAYPMSDHGARVGVLTLYQRAGGDLTDAQHSDSLAMAGVLAETVLSLQNDAPEGSLAESLEEAIAYRAEIHQASGMVAVQLQIPVTEALMRIRAHAFSTSRAVGVVAGDVVARRLRLADDRNPTAERE
jgi:hypothetical protein